MISNADATSLQLQASGREIQQSIYDVSHYLVGVP